MKFSFLGVMLRLANASCKIPVTKAPYLFSDGTALNLNGHTKALTWRKLHAICTFSSKPLDLLLFYLI